MRPPTTTRHASRQRAHRWQRPTSERCGDEKWPRGPPAIAPFGIIRTRSVSLSLPTSVASSLFMALGRIALETVDEPGLGRAEREPLAPGLLQRDEELSTAVHSLLVKLVPALEFGLESELAAERMVSAPLAPDSDVRIGDDVLAEVQLPKVLKNFLNYSLVHQFDGVGVRGLQRRQRREHALQGPHRRAIPLGRLTEGKLDVVREQQPISPGLIFQRQDLRLELDPIVTGDLRPHVLFRGLLHVRVAELEDDFRFARREAVFVEYPPSQDERMVIELEIGGVQEEHFTDLRFKDHILIDEVDPEILCGPRHQLAIFEERFCGRKAVGFQDKLALEILNLIEWTAVAVFPLLEIGLPRGRQFLHRHHCSSHKCRTRIKCRARDRSPRPARLSPPLSATAAAVRP